MDYKSLVGKSIVNIEVIYSSKQFYINDNEWDKRSRNYQSTYRNYSQVKNDKRFLFEIKDEVYFVYPKEECDNYYGDETLKITTSDGEVFYILSSCCCFSGEFKFVSSLNNLII